MNNMLSDIFQDIARPVIGMVHLRALPGAPGYDGDLAAVHEAALHDAQALAEGGVNGLMLENFGDIPFHKDRVPPRVVAHLTAIAARLRQHVDLPMGINVLRNDGRSALAVAHAVGAQWVRVNVLTGARVTDQGIIEGIAADLMRDRAALSGTEIAVFADVNVKHSAPLASIPFDQEVEDLVRRGNADALIVSGSGTGREIDLYELKSVRSVTGDCPVLIGSGATQQNIGELAELADGFIVGSSLKHDGKATEPVDINRVRKLMEALG